MGCKLVGFLKFASVLQMLTAQKKGDQLFPACYFDVYYKIRGAYSGSSYLYEDLLVAGFWFDMNCILPKSSADLF